MSEVQLISTGRQEELLNNNPHVDLLKQKYQRYSNFAISNELIECKSKVDFDKIIEIDIPNNKGDLLHQMFVSFTLPKLTNPGPGFVTWTNSIGHAIIDYVEVRMDHYTISKMTGVEMEIYRALNDKQNKDDTGVGYYKHIQLLETVAENETNYMVPLQFWFCKDLQNSLPVSKMKGYPLTIRIKLNSFEDCILYDSTAPSEVSIKEFGIIADYVILPYEGKVKLQSEERIQLIEQHQYYTSLIPQGITNINEEILFGGSCTSIVFALQSSESKQNNDHFNFAQRTVSPTDTVKPILSHASLEMDNLERFRKMTEYELRKSETKEYYKNETDRFIYTLPFNANPDILKTPSGSCNFSNSNLSVAMLLSLQKNATLVDNILHVSAKFYNFIHFTGDKVLLYFSD